MTLRTFRLGSQADLVRLAHQRGWIERAQGSARTERLPPVRYIDGDDQGLLPEVTLSTQPSYQLRIPEAVIHGRNLSLLIEDGAYPGGVAHSFIPSQDWRRLGPTQMAFDPSTVTRLAPGTEMLGIVSHWGHFFVDALDRLLFHAGDKSVRSSWLVSDHDLFNLRPALDAHGVVPQVSELMRLLPEPPDASTLTPLHKAGNFEASNLTVVTLPVVKPAMNADALRRLRDLASRAAELPDTNPDSTLFVGRRDVKKRFLVGQDRFIEHLDNVHGAATFFPEDHSLAESISRFNGAWRVILPIGSAKFNLAFCEPGTKVVCVTPRGYAAQNGGVVVMTRHICHALGLDLAFYGVPIGDTSDHLLNSNMVLDRTDGDAMMRLLDAL
jgi:capsular polysaccharide biosynthesis protein